MGTLASELRPIVAELTDCPRVYVDANVPLGVVSAMRQQCHWDVLFVLEHDDLRRAADAEHFRRALDLGRTLITLDHDFFDDRRFPLESSPGVVICSAPDETALIRLLHHLDRHVLRAGSEALPLRGRKMEMTPSVFAEHV
jgi:predicted nuclease of predicted toxin-antitoxin system